jgi:hypothetical protein
MTTKKRKGEKESKKEKTGKSSTMLLCLSACLVPSNGVLINLCFLLKDREDKRQNKQLIFSFIVREEQFFFLKSIS